MNAPNAQHFRQILTWPLHLVRAAGVPADQTYWDLLERHADNAGWQRFADEFGTAEHPFEERHYKEFVVFLPHVQRFLYGEAHSSKSHAANDPPGEAARKVYHRNDVAALRVVLRAGQPAIVLQVQRIELWFFDDVDVAFLVVEISAADLPFAIAHDVIYRFGRAYPTGWNEHNGQGVHNACSTEWLGHDGQVLAASDAGQREHYLDFARTHRAPTTSAHWTWLLKPLVLDAADKEGPIRFRQIEYHRMPLMAYLAFDDPFALARNDWIRLGLVATVHPDEPLSAGDPDVADFDARYCYDRYWAGTPDGPNTRILCSGRALIVVGKAEPYFLDNNRGMLAQFRHQYFILFMISHFHRAALLIFSDLLVDAIHDLDIRRTASVRRFGQRIRACFESFLRFTHRYWFHELSERPHMQAINRMCAQHLGSEALFEEVKEELRDMSQYLDTEAARRTNRLFMRLNIVTVFSIIGTVATGFLGMNIFALAEEPVYERLAYFALALGGVFSILLVAVMMSRQLSEMMDVLSNDNLPLGTRLRELLRWRRQGGTLPAGDN